MKITKTSNLTGKQNTMDIPLTSLEFDMGELRRANGELIQNVYPNLDNEQREFLISGITPEEWSEIF